MGVQMACERDALTDELKIMVTITEETIKMEDYLNDRRYNEDSRHTMIVLILSFIFVILSFFI